ncbi:hypothetical protein JZ751_018313 [Albula glossodonta]|uniref:Uncharacterized protein n=1 Tax=Albula glossodonta TaxID=121402 RepID=A0A8T2NNQ4_9TELE|nr:hypothetical protein JZ751_018313 [Albula glossodonta]
MVQPCTPPGSVSQSQGFGGGQDTHPTLMIRDDTPRLAIKKSSVNAHMKLVGFSTSNKRERERERERECDEWRGPPSLPVYGAQNS